jgi:hypothetical protein
MRQAVEKGVVNGMGTDADSCNNKLANEVQVLKSTLTRTNSKL